MDIKAARAAIEAILAAIPDDELPEFDKVEINRDGVPAIVWWGGTGHHLGTAKRGQKRNPIGYRERGSWGAIEAEMTYRADQRLLDNGDDATGVDLAAKVVKG